MKYSEIKRKLKRAGCYCKREGANHEIWYSPATDRMFPVPDTILRRQKKKQKSQSNNNRGLNSNPL